MVEIDDRIVLAVPALDLRRRQIIEQCRLRARESRLQPPVSYKVIKDEAARILENLTGKPEELAFTILMFSNELWRPFFDSTPPQRRLLLLPQCLKSSSSCTATIDELGLICNGCGQCKILDLVTESEKLGYATVVAEGTAMAKTLIENGSVDALLGVSCMETLKNFFTLVVSSGVPSIAIPLLNDGCKDTAVDETDLIQNIRSGCNSGRYSNLSMPLLKDRVESFFARTTLQKRFDPITTETITAQMAIDAILTGGKRTRPLLCLLAYTAYTDFADEKIGDDLVFAVECFHKASLIHDDLEDQDDSRYGKKTVHIEKGLPLAVNLGDFLTGYGYKTISSLNLSDTIKSQLFSLFSTLHVDSSIGQGEDLFHTRENSVPDFSRTITIFEKKTGSAIKASLQAGAVAAGAPVSELEILGEFSLLLGTAYQIFDDSTEFQGTAKDQNRASYPFLKSLAAEKKLTADSSDDWKSLILENGILEEAQTILDSYLVKIESSLNKLQATQLKLALLRIVNYIFKT